MTKRQVIDTILREKETPERMGICEDFWPETVRFAWPEQGFGKDTDPTARYDLDIVDLNEYWRGWRFRLESFPDQYKVLEEDHETVVYVDGWGATVRRFKKHGGPPEHIAFGLNSRDAWEKTYREPLLHLDKARFPDLDDLKRRFKAHSEEGFYTMYNNTFVFENMRYSMGDVIMLESMIDDPEWIHDFCRVFTDFTITHLDFLFGAVGVPDAYTIYDDMAYTKSSFCSPAMYREFITPYHKRLVGFLKDHGAAVILHTDGLISKHFDSFIEAGIDCVQPMEAKTGMDMFALANAYGDRIAFMGNIDIRALETNDHARIEKEILPKLERIRRERIPYIFHSDHSISTLVRIESYEYALKLFRENCRYR